MIRVSEIKLPLDATKQDLQKRLAHILRIPAAEIKGYRIFKRSLDARHKNDIHYVYVVDVEVAQERRILEKNREKGRI